jgi:hypothetical protein
MVILTAWSCRVCFYLCSWVFLKVMSSPTPKQKLGSWQHLHPMSGFHPISLIPSHQGITILVIMSWCSFWSHFYCTHVNVIKIRQSTLHLLKPTFYLLLIAKIHPSCRLVQIIPLSAVLCSIVWLYQLIHSPIDGIGVASNIL